jgi:hypothetical protein
MKEIISGRFGVLVDQFGMNLMFDFEKTKA